MPTEGKPAHRLEGPVCRKDPQSLPPPPFPPRAAWHSPPGPRRLRGTSSSRSSSSWRPPRWGDLPPGLPVTSCRMEERPPRVSSWYPITSTTPMMRLRGGVRWGGGGVRRTRVAGTGGGGTGARERERGRGGGAGREVRGCVCGWGGGGRSGYVGVCGTRWPRSCARTPTREPVSTASGHRHLGHNSSSTKSGTTSGHISDLDADMRVCGDVHGLA